MLDTNSIFSNLAIAHNRFYQPTEAVKVEIQNKLVVEHVFLASV